MLAARRPGPHDRAAGRPDRAVRRRHHLHAVLRRSRADPRPHRRVPRLSRRRRPRGRREVPAGGVPERDGRPCPGHPRRGAGLQRPRLPSCHEPPGPAAPVEGRGRSRIDPRPPLQGGGHPRTRPPAPHGDGDVVGRLERGHRHRAHRGTPTTVDDSPSRDAYTQGYQYGGRGGAPSRPCDEMWRSSTGTSRRPPEASAAGYGPEEAATETAQPSGHC